MRKKKDQRDIDSTALMQYNQALEEGISKGQLIEPKYVRVWKTSTRSGKGSHVYNYNCFHERKKEQVARFDANTGVLQVFFNYYLPLDHDNIPDLITMMSQGKKRLMRLLGKKEGHQLIYVLDGQLSRKHKGLYYTYAELTTRLKERPSVITLYEIESVFRDVLYCDRHGVNRWLEESSCTIKREKDKQEPPFGS